MPRLRPLLLGLLAAAALGPAARPQDAPPRLSFPLACVIGKTCEIQHYVDRDPGPGVKDYRCGPETYEGHKGVDIRLLDMAAQRAGVDVLAAAPGRVARLRDAVPDISVRAPGAPSVANQECGNGVVIDHGGGWETQYCHLARGSVRVKVGEVVQAGTPIARVGLSGDTEFPHMHIQVLHAGRIVDPFAPDMSQPGTCAPQAPLWTPQAMAMMPYKPGAVLNTGFAGAPVQAGDIEAGGIAPPVRSSAALVVYARGIGLLAGDSLELELKGPDGAILARDHRPPSDHWQAQQFMWVGRKAAGPGWPAGTYVAEFRIWRAGAVAASRRFTATL